MASNLGTSQIACYTRTGPTPDAADAPGLSSRSSTRLSQTNQRSIRGQRPFGDTQGLRTATMDPGDCRRPAAADRRIERGQPPGGALRGEGAGDGLAPLDRSRKPPPGATAVDCERTAGGLGLPPWGK